MTAYKTLITSKMSSDSYDEFAEKHDAAVNMYLAEGYSVVNTTPAFSNHGGVTVLVTALVR